MSEPTTVGDLEPDAIVLRLSYGRAVHLPNSECAHLSRETDAPQRKRAATLWNDTEICADCRGEQFRRTGGREHHLPTQTEVPSDD
jgi:hypothetical protein